MAPNVPRGYSGLGQLFGNQDKWAGALQVFTQGLESNPQDSGLLYDAACAGSRLERLDEAMGYIERLVVLEDNLLGQAMADEDLKFLREHPDFANRFVALVKGQVESSSC